MVVRHEIRIEVAMTESRCGLTAADLAAIRERDSGAVALFYRAHADTLYRFLLASTGDVQLAEDLTGSVFAAALEALPTFHGPVEDFRGWLFGIARRDLTDFRPRHGGPPVPSMAGQIRGRSSTGGDQDAEGAAPARLHSEDVLAACRQLPAEQREVVLLRMVGLGATEIARVLGTTPRVVKALQRRGLARLARRLGLLPERKGVFSDLAGFRWARR
jgi:RNA polymerase sigma-70 factor (ECF subfamily)